MEYLIDNAFKELLNIEASLNWILRRVTSLS